MSSEDLNSEFLEAFFEEFDELFAIAQNALASLVQGDNSQVSEIYRAFHTLKGSAALFDFHRLTRLSAVAENFLALMRSDDAPQMTPEQLSILEECLQTMKKFREAIAAGKNEESIPVASLIEAIQAHTPK